MASQPSVLWIRDSTVGVLMGLLAATHRAAFDVCHAIGTDPFNTIAILPYAQPRLPFRIRELALAMLLSIDPATFVLLAIWPLVETLTMLLVLDVVPLVEASVFIVHLSMSVHQVPLPMTAIFPSISPNVLTNAMEFITPP